MSVTIISPLLSNMLTSVLQIRTASAEYMCQLLPGVDLEGREEAVEEVLLETEWWAQSIDNPHDLR